MEFILDEVKTMITQVANEISTNLKSLLRVENCSARMAFLGYRDYTVTPTGVKDEVRFDRQDFTDNINQLMAHIQTMQAEGGADEAEDVVGALNETLQLSWENNVKILFIMGDSPCHGKQYNGGCEDFDPNLEGPDKKGCPKPEDLFLKAAGMGINIIYCIIPHRDGRVTTTQMSEAFKQLYEDAGRKWTDVKMAIQGNDFKQVIVKATLKKINDLVFEKT